LPHHQSKILNMEQKKKIKRLTVLFFVLVLVNIFSVTWTDKHGDIGGHSSGGKFEVSLSLSPHQTEHAYEFSSDVNPVYSMYVNVPVPNAALLTKLFYATWIVNSLAMLLFLYELISMLINVLKGNVFDKSNERRLKIMGYSYIACFVGYLILVWLVDAVLYFKYKGGYFAHSFSIYTIDWGYLIIALFIIILAELFSLARTMKEEQDFTV